MLEFFFATKWFVNGRYEGSWKSYFGWWVGRGSARLLSQPTYYLYTIQEHLAPLLFLWLFFDPSMVGYDVWVCWPWITFLCSFACWNIAACWYFVILCTPFQIPCKTGALDHSNLPFNWWKKIEKNKVKSWVYIRFIFIFFTFHH